ncbi:MAG TPA: glycoside hydrolase family 130 protein, partial [Ignavibacteria bacterium]|nr:glycoside hydrolase family 130 protein [Ignavibacteria bacterium]
MRITVNRKNERIYPDPGRVITRYFDHGELKANSIVKKIYELSEVEAEISLNTILMEFAKRHRNITQIFLVNYTKMCRTLGAALDNKELSFIKKLLIGSYFTMEYSIESAALFNPSIVEHPDQNGLEDGQKRIIVSFRATGESHISSLVFRSGIIDKENNILLDPQGNYISEAEIIKGYEYSKVEFIGILREHSIHNNISSEVLDQLEDTFYYIRLKETIKRAQENQKLNLDQKKTLKEMMWLAKSHYEVVFSLDTDISERVIFPISRTESNGIEDARFVKFREDDGEIIYFATYTAYDGYTILPKLLETKDFYHFKNLPLHGECTRDKNFALFPRKVNSKYAMLSRIDGVNQYIMFSDSLTVWETAQVLWEPQYNWELIKVGNCGSPIETDAGWLVITHGVGSMRKYCLGAIMLDLNDPSKVIGSLKEPLIIPNEDEREGYVPNVVYSCGSIIHGSELIIPYAISDYASSFASVNVNLLINKLLEK